MVVEKATGRLGVDPEEAIRRIVSGFEVRPLSRAIHNEVTGIARKGNKLH